MTQTEALKMALEALEELHAMVWGECPSLLNEDSGGDSTLDMECKQAITAIKEALAQPEQEPVALKPCWYESKKMTMCPKCGQVHAEAIIDTTPPQRKPLTRGQIREIEVDVSLNPSFDYITPAEQLCRAIEAAHGIKE